MPRDVDIESHEAVVNQIFENLRELPPQGRKTIIQSNLAYLNSTHALTEYSPASLAYLLKVWHDVSDRWVAEDAATEETGGSSGDTVWTDA